jgi:4-carboxymuconolactone decarboxylase
VVTTKPIEDLKDSHVETGGPRKDLISMDPSCAERLRQLAINDGRLGDLEGRQAVLGSRELDAKMLALVRIAGLVAVGGAVPSFGAQADAAIAAGASDDEMVDVLMGLIPIVGLPCVVSAAPRLAMALGYDTEEEL